MRYLQGVIPYFSCLLTEDSSQQSFLGSQLGLALRCYLTDEDIARAYLGTYSDDTVLVQILQSVIAHVWDISCDLLRSQLGISCFCLQIFDMDRSILILLYKVLVQQNGVLVVVTFPGHEADQCVLTKRKFAVGGSGTVTDYLVSLDTLALFNDRSLVCAGTCVGSLELCQLVGVHIAVVLADNDLVSVNALNNTCLGGYHCNTGVDTSLVLHTCTNDRRLGLQQRHSLPLHVRSHQRTVRIIVLQEGDTSSSD